MMWRQRSEQCSPVTASPLFSSPWILSLSPQSIFYWKHFLLPCLSCPIWVLCQKKHSLPASLLWEWVLCVEGTKPTSYFHFVYSFQLDICKLFVNILKLILTPMNKKLFTYVRTCPFKVSTCYTAGFFHFFFSRVFPLSNIYCQEWHDDTQNFWKTSVFGDLIGDINRIPISK